MKNTKARIARKIVAGLAIVIVFAIGLMFIGVFIDIQIILKYNYTPISFTFTFLFGGALIGLLLAYRITRKKNGLE